MATNNNEGYVNVHVPKGTAGDDPNLFVSINGKNYLLPRGTTCKVPARVKREIERSQRAQEAFDKKSEALLEKAQKPIY